MDSIIRAARIKEIKFQFTKKRETGLIFGKLTEQQRAVALVRMESHCFAISDQSRFTFEFEGNTLVKMIDHAAVMENILE